MPTTVHDYTPTEALGLMAGVRGFKRLAAATRHVAADPTTPSVWDDVTGSDLVTNGNFDSDTGWTKGTGWTIASGYASSDGSQGGDADMTQALGLTPAAIYQVVFTVANYSAGNVTAVVGDQEGTDRAANGTFTEYITCGAGTDFDLRADLNFVGDVDTVSVKLVTPGANLVTNGSMAADSDWTKGVGWTIVSGYASSDGSQAGDADMTQALGLTPGSIYQVTFTVANRSAGNVCAVVGDTEGTDRGGDGTFTQYITCGAGTDFDIRANANFVGDVDTVSVKLVTPAADLVTNGAMAADSDWTKGVGWTIAAGVASSDGTQVADADLTQTFALTPGGIYQVTFTVSGYAAGNVCAVVGDTEGTDRAADGTFVEYITAGAGADFDIRADADFVGNIDNVIVKLCSVGVNLAANSTFATSASWTLGTGWSITTGYATSDGTQVANADLTQTIAITPSVIYQVTFTVSGYSAGNVRPVVGDTAGTNRSANGTFIEYITCGAGGDIDIRADLDFVGRIDDVVVKEAALGSNLAANSTFATAASWTLGTGWTITTGYATSDGSQVAVSDLEQTVTLTNSAPYRVIYTVSERSAGNVRPVIGGTAGTNRATNATFTETVVASTVDKVAMRADADFVGRVDVVSVYAAVSYTAGDYVSHGGADYVCILTHNVDAPVDEPGVGTGWSTYWKLLELHPTITEFVRVKAVGSALVFGGSCVSTTGDIPSADDTIRQDDELWVRMTTVDVKTGYCYAYYR